MSDDLMWVNQVLQGNKQAYAHLINKYKDKIYYLLVRMGEPPQDAQDVAQECFIKAYHYLHSYDQSRKFSSWLYRIAINHCLDLKRRKSKTVNLHIELEENTIAETKSPETIYLTNESKTELSVLVNSLPENYRLVLLLRYIDDLTYKEISEICKLSVNTVQVRLHRAKQMLREHFQTTKKGGELR
ncbi:RNA polymerase sigma factor [Brevibacillus sp. SYSU BS000544]|uniref:RNA polymerase sigma factor n=1 Tax=Brevibacillus sp. SYSU BS000544 TaxID=3416443 RepID=UPI003CE4D7CF